MNQHHLGAAAMAREVDKTGELPHLFHLNLHTGFPLSTLLCFPLLRRQAFRLEPAEIRMAALPHPGAAGAVSACAAILRRALAQQGACQRLGASQLADAIAAPQQKRVGQPALTLEQCFKRPKNPWIYHL